jgi:integrase
MANGLCPLTVRVIAHWGQQSCPFDGQVLALELGDIDWRAGEIVVRGKARRQDRLPLPAEVGQGLDEYLRDARPPAACRQVVLTIYAPVHNPTQHAHDGRVQGL